MPITIQFRLEYLVQHFLFQGGIAESQPVVLRVRDDPPLTVAIRKLSADEIVDGRSGDDAIAVSNLVRTASVEISQGLEELAENFPITPEDLDEPLRTYIQDTNQLLHDGLERAVKVLRWRHFRTSPLTQFASLGSQFSTEGESWHPLPQRFIGHPWSQGMANPSDRTVAETTQLLLDGWEEPICHELLREAWSHRLESPRSALIVAVASVEVGIKECISDLVPGASWLAQNAPSPPVDKMFRDYLKTLPARQSVKGEARPPSKRLLNVLKKAIDLRNDIIHAGAKPPSLGELDEVIHCAADLLWMLDFYRGHEWAVEHMTMETRSEMGLDSEVES